MCCGLYRVREGIFMAQGTGRIFIAVVAGMVVRALVAGVGRNDCQQAP